MKKSSHQGGKNKMKNEYEEKLARVTKIEYEIKKLEEEKFSLINEIQVLRLKNVYTKKLKKVN